MTDKNQEPEVEGRIKGGLMQEIAHRFSLLDDKADDIEIERRIRDGVELAGATPWILMFAILVASVGLNVNSAAVIIGAMLISPLMGPIMGAGFGVAVYDFALVKRSLFNLGIATLISLIVSTLYFSLSPLQEAQSELLSRTTPTIWDVLIALFGGLAGIVATTREEKSNVIPGVAIATALMPPVCTAGYGLATGQWSFVAGALYLYTINCVFISLATIIGIRALKLKRHGFADYRMEKRVKISLLVLTLGTALPSGYLAINLVKDEVFKTNARKFISQEFSFETTHVAEAKIDPDKQVIDLVLIGVRLNNTTLKNIEGRLSLAQLAGTRILVHQMGDNMLDVTALKSSLLSDLYRESQQAMFKKDEQIQKLEQELVARNAIIGKSDEIYAELRAQLPSVTTIFVGEGVELLPNIGKKQLLQLSIKSSNTLSKNDQIRIENWFKARMKTDAVVLHFEIEPLIKKNNPKLSARTSRIN